MTSTANSTAIATSTAPPTDQPDRYLAPGFVTRRLANPLMAAITRMGFSPRGSRVLHVRGRSSGQWHTVPVNPLTFDGQQYLIAPRGETQWVRNMRVAHCGRLQLGRRLTEFSAVEVTDAGIKAPILQAYLRVWRSEVGAFFDGVDGDSLDELRAIADGYPMFVIHTSTPAGEATDASSTHRR
jgi:hypothetical protein